MADYSDSFLARDAGPLSLSEPLLGASVRAWAPRCRLVFALCATAGLLAIAAATSHLRPRLILSSSPCSVPPPPLPRRILVTGYLPWGGMDANPASMVALALNSTCEAGVCIEGRTLAVNRSGAMEVAAQLAAGGQRSTYDAVVHLGVGFGGRAVSVGCACHP